MAETRYYLVSGMVLLKRKIFGPIDHLSYICSNIKVI